jgi:uncharacterized membrane protein YoaK (UPF0700 family)
VSPRARDILVILLALTTGATDAAAFERLGNAFASVITGNLVLLGVGAAKTDGRLALVSGCALAGYAVGVAVAAPRSSDNPEPRPNEWPRSATAALAAAFALLAVEAVGWELSGGRPGREAQVLLLALAAIAMGMQSTAVRRLGPMSTTYLTSTFIGVFEAMVARRLTDQHARSAAILAVALAGAAGAVGLISAAPRLAPVLQLVPLLVVILASRALIKQKP